MKELIIKYINNLSKEDIVFLLNKENIILNNNELDFVYTLLKNAIADDTIDGMKNKMAMKAIEKISKTYKEKKDIKWNFTKFLVDRDGNIVGRYSPTYKPEDMKNKIKELI